MKRVSTAMLLGMLTAAAFLSAGQLPHPDPCDADNGGLTLPSGFCAAIVADGLGPARHLTVAPNGDLFVELHAPDATPSIVALRDTDGDGRFDQQERFGEGLSGTAIAWHNNYLYVGADTQLVRFQMDGVSLRPISAAEVIVGGLPDGGAHAAKSFAFGEHGEVYIHVGAPTNACQGSGDRDAGVPGERPCPDLTLGAGIWKYSADTPGQLHASQNRFATGIRHTVGVVWNASTHSVWAVQNGRDQLSLWSGFDAEANANLPAEELLDVTQDADFGWPYCYFDPFQNKRVQAPEYAGDGHTVGDCAKYARPTATFPAHYAPLDLLFYAGSQFPAQYHNGVFVSFHGSWNRSPLPEAGYNVMFQPLRGNVTSGSAVIFADGFAETPAPSPSSAQHRPVGLAEAHDGAMYVSDDSGGRIWKISYIGGR
jgi:glucose/arabinose dehydrogenase